MTYYLKDLLPRLKKYSAELDHSTFLVDKPWVVSGEEHGPFQKLIFRRDGRVHLSNNGNLTDGKWEYLPEAKALIIDYGENKKLFRHEFLDESVLALKVDGRKAESDKDYFLLSNENTVPDTNAKLYLKNKYLKASNSKAVEFENGKEVYLKPTSPYPNHNKFEITDENGPLLNGIHYTKGGRSRYLVKNGMAGKPQTLRRYFNDISIWQAYDTPQLEDEVIGLAEGSFEHIINSENYRIDVKGSKVVKTTNKTENKRLFIITALITVATIGVILFSL